MSKADTKQSPPDPDSAPISDPPGFEQSMKELEALVDRLEQDDLTLEESLAAFERGIKLTRVCQQALDTAEQRVRILTDQSEHAEPEQYHHDVIPNTASDRSIGKNRNRDE